MTVTDQFKGTPFDENADNTTIPGLLKVLTILTYIGCAIGLLFSVYNAINAKKGLDALEKMQGSDDLEKLPDFVKKMYSQEAIDLARVTYENRVPLTVLNLVGIALCFYGAVQMRQLKKQGYFLWLIGEILPLIGLFIFVGATFFGTFSGIITLIIFAVFLLLYSLQLKYLK